MKTHKIELKIVGQLFGIGYTVFLEGQEFRLYESPQHVYTRVFDAFPIEEPLDVLIQLRGWFGTKWNVELSLDGVVVFTKDGTFPRKEIISISEKI